MTEYILSTDTGKAIGPPAPAESYRHYTASPDGRRAAGLNQKGDLEVRDLAGGQVLTSAMRHEGPVQSWSFSADGRYLLSISADNAVRVWAADSGMPITPVLKHDRHVDLVRPSPDGSRFLTISGNAVRLWPLIPAPLERAVLSHDHAVRRAELSADGRRVVTTSQELSHPGSGPTPALPPEVRVWDAASGRLIASKRPDANNPLGEIAGLSGDGRRLLLVHSQEAPRGTKNKRCQVWDIDADRLTPLDVPRTGSLSASFSSDGNYVRVTSKPPQSPQTGEVRLWDAATGKPAGPAISGLFIRNEEAWSPDGTRWATAVAKGKACVVRVFDMRTGKEVFAPLPHDEPALSISFILFSEDGRRLVTIVAGQPCHVRVWDLGTGLLLSRLPPLNGFVGTPPMLNRDGSRLLLVVREEEGALARARVWDVASGRALIGPQSDEHDLDTASLSPDGSLVVTGTPRGTARVWDAATGEPRTPVLAHGRSSLLVRFSDDGRRLLTGLYGAALSLGEFRVWDAATGHPLSGPLSPPGGGHWFAFEGQPVSASSDANRLLFVHERSVTVCDLSGDGRPVEELLALTQLLSCRRVNSAGNLQMIEAGRFEVLWKDLRTRRTGQWTRPVLSGPAWHAQQARECYLGDPSFTRGLGMDVRAAFSAVWHLDRLLAVEPNTSGHYVTRALAHESLHQWERVVADSTRAIEGKIDTLWAVRGKAYAQMGRWKEAEADFQRAVDSLGKSAGDTPESLAQVLRTLALLRLHRGDEAGYRAICEKLLARALKNATPLHLFSVERGFSRPPQLA